MQQQAIGELVADSKPRFIPNNSSLEGQYVSLQAIEPKQQAHDLYLASHGSAEKEHVWTYLPQGGPFADQDIMEQWLEAAKSLPGFVFYSVYDQIKHRYVGMCSYCSIDTANQRMELGYIWYDPVVQRSKVNTETIYLMLCEAFDVLNYRRVEWKCDSLNQPSRNAALRLGFHFEGIFKQHMIIKGHNRDTAWYAMMDYEWPAIKENMKRWLYGAGEYFSLAEANHLLRNDSSQSI